jgi:hypothetical protein
MGLEVLDKVQEELALQNLTKLIFILRFGTSLHSLKHTKHSHFSHFCHAWAQVKHMKTNICISANVQHYRFKIILHKTP